MKVLLQEEDEDSVAEEADEEEREKEVEEEDVVDFDESESEKLDEGTFELPSEKDDGFSCSGISGSSGGTLGSFCIGTTSCTMTMTGIGTGITTCPFPSVVAFGFVQVALAETLHVVHCTVELI